MPALAAITINDGATTPLAHTFSPVTTDGWLAQLQEKVGIPKGQATLSVSVRPPASGSPMYKARVQIKLPNLAVDSNGRQTVAYTNLVTMEFLSHEEATDQNRKDMLAFAKNALAHATLNTVLLSNEPIY